MLCVSSFHIASSNEECAMFFEIIFFCYFQGLYKLLNLKTYNSIENSNYKSECVTSNDIFAFQVFTMIEFLFM